MSAVALPATDGRLLFRVPVSGDVDAVLAHAQHEDMSISHWLPIRTGATRDEAAALTGELVLGWHGAGRHGPVLLVSTRPGDVMIGVVYLPSVGDFELAYGVAPDYRNQGHATAAVRMASRWLFETRPHLDHLELLIAPGNGSSRRVAGCVQLGVRAIARGCRGARLRPGFRTRAGGLRAGGA